MSNSNTPSASGSSSGLNFKSDQKSSLFRAAVQAIEALVTAEGTGSGIRAYAAASWQTRRESYAKDRGLQLTGGRVCIQRLLGKQCGYQYHRPSYSHICSPPADDHPSLWNENGKPARYLSQPYQLGTRNLKEIVEFVERLKLDVLIATYPSFHFPGAVLSVEYRPRDDQDTDK